jgi:branched-chain amino acid transport system ATP-binding protein
VARALAADPKIVLLDEVAAGLNPTETLRAMDMIKRIRDEMGITVFWVEHVMKAIMNVAERIIVLNYGEKIAEGKPSEIARDENVIKAYLGEKYIL